MYDFARGLKIFAGAIIAACTLSANAAPVFLGTGYVSSLEVGRTLSNGAVCGYFRYTDSAGNASPWIMFQNTASGYKEIVASLLSARAISANLDVYTKTTVASAPTTPCGSYVELEYTVIK